MNCSACGEALAADARFCRNCGAPAPLGAVTSGPPADAVPAPFTEAAAVADAVPADASPTLVSQPAAPTPAAQPFTPVPPPPDQLTPTVIMPRPAPPGGPVYPSGPGGPDSPQGGGRRGLWIAIAVLAVVVIALAVAVVLVLTRGESDTQTTTTTKAASTTTTVASEEETTTTSARTTTTAPETTTTTAPAEAPGDSDGEWVEIEIPGASSMLTTVALSDYILLMTEQGGDTSTIYVYDFATGKTTELPTKASDAAMVDVDGYQAVWWEGDYDEGTGDYKNEHIYSMELPKGPKVEIAGGGKAVAYPQVAGATISWVEPSPWEANPDEFMQAPIYGTPVPTGGVASPVRRALVPSPLAFVAGDSSWTYSLGRQYVAWEQTAPNGGLQSLGTYILDHTDPLAKPALLVEEGWRPSIGDNTLVYWKNGLKAYSLTSSDTWDIDPEGDFPTAGPTFVAYFRPSGVDEGAGWDIVVRGLGGGHEQILQHQAYPPWLSPFIAASTSRIAVLGEDRLHVYEWKGR